MPNRYKTAFFPTTDTRIAAGIYPPNHAEAPPQPATAITRPGKIEPYPIGILAARGLGLTQSSTVSIGHVIPMQAVGEAGLMVWANVATGNLVVQNVMTPIFESGRVFSCGFTYNSLAANAGAAFTFSLDRRINPSTFPPNPRGTITLREGDGHLTDYIPDPVYPNLYFAVACGHGRPFLSYDATRNEMVHYHPGTEITTYFNAQGECIRERDKMGRELVFEYKDNPIHGQPRLLSKFYRPGSDTQYLLDTEFTPTGKVVTLSQHIPNRPDQVLQGNTFNASGCLVQTDLGGAGVEPYRILFSYNSLVDRTRPYYLDRITQSDGTQLRFDFEQPARIPDVTPCRVTACHFGDVAAIGDRSIQFTYTNPTPATFTTIMQDRGGMRTAFDLDSYLRLCTQTHFTTTNTQDNAPREVMHYTYVGELEQLASLTNSRGGITQYGYRNVYGLCTHITAPDGQMTEYVYDTGSMPASAQEAGSSTHPTAPLQHVDPLEAKEVQASQEDINRRPNCISVTRYRTDGPTQTAQTIRYVYDLRDLLANKHFARFVISPTGAVTEYQADDRGDVASARLYGNAPFDLTPYSIPSSVPAMATMQRWLAEPAQAKSHTALTEFLHDPSSALNRCRRFTELDDQGVGIENAAFEETHYGRDTLGRIVEVATREVGEQEEAKDEQSQVTATTHYQYDFLTRTTRVTDALDHQVETQYPPAEAGLFTRTQTQPNGRQESVVQDSRGQVVETREQAANAEGIQITRSTRYRMDVSGLPAVITLPDQTLQLRFYDGLRRPLYEISHTGRVVAHYYDAQHGIESTVRYERTINPTFEEFWPDRNSLPSLSLFEFHVMPALIAGNQLIQQRLYDRSGRVCYTADESGALTEIRYDSLNRPIAHIVYATPLSPAAQRDLLAGILFTPPIPDPSVDCCTQMRYDENTSYPTYLPLPLSEDAALPPGIAVRQDPAGYVTVYKRDAGGRALERMQYQNRLPIQLNRDIALENIIPNPDQDARYQFLHDGRHQCIQEIDPDGFVSSHSYFSSGKHSQTRQHVQTGAADPNDRTTDYSYDLLRQLIGLQNSQGLAQLWVHDNMRQVTQEVTYDATRPTAVDPEVRREQRQRYDGFGALIAQTNPFVSAAIYAIELDDSLPPEEKERDITLLWQTQSTRHIYEPQTGLKQSSIDPLGQASFNYYDLEHRLQFQIGKGFELVEHTLDVFNRETQTQRYVRLIPEPDRLALTGGFLTPELTQRFQDLGIAQDAVTRRTFDPCSRVLTETDPEGILTARTYDSFGACIKEDLPGRDAQTRLYLTHQFEARGLETQTIREGTNGLTITLSREYSSLHGRETLRIDERGARWQTGYHRRPLIASTTDPIGAIQRKDYDGFARILTETDARGAQTTHLYKEQAREHETHSPARGVFLQTIQNVFGETVIQADALGTTQISHAYDGQIASVRNPLQHTTAHQYNRIGLKTQTTQPDGSITLFEHDTLARLIQTTADAEGIARIEKITYLDPLGQTVETTNARGITRLERRDRRGLLTSVTTDPQGLGLQESFTYTPGRTQQRRLQGDTQQPGQARTHYEDDALNRRVLTTVDPNGLALQTRVSLDQAGLVRSTLDPEGQVSWIFYDNNRRPIITLDPMGGIKQIRYDANGNSIQTRIYATALPTSQLVQITPSTYFGTLERWLIDLQSVEDTQTYRFYDANDCLRFEVTGLGKLLETTYNVANCPIQTRHYVNPITPNLIPTLTTDSLATLAESLRDDLLDQVAFQCLDAAKQVRYTIDAAGYVTEQCYDACGRRIATLQYITPVADPAAIALLPIEEIAARIQTNPAEDRITLTFFDALSQPVFTLTPADGSNPTGEPLYQVKRFTYDPAGNLIARRQYVTLFAIPQVPQTPQAWSDMQNTLLAFPTDPNDRVTQTEFDPANRETAHIDALGYRDIDTLNALGQITVRTDRAGNSTDNAWDTAGRLVSELSPAVPAPDSKTELRIETRHTYDKCDRPLTSTVGYDQPDALQTACAYNPCGKLVRTDVSAPNLGNSPVKTTLLYRNARQQVIATKNPGGNYAFILYDADMQISFTVDGTGAAVARQYNGIEDEVMQRSYATRLPAALQTELVAYAAKGQDIPTHLITETLLPADMDGVVCTDWNNRREKIRTRTAALPGFGVADPHAVVDRVREMQYTPFGEIQAEIDLLPGSAGGSPALNSARLHLFWYNRAGKPVGECTPEKRVTRTQYSAFLQISRQSTWASPPQITVSPTTTIAELDAAHLPATSDQTFQWQHNTRGEVAQHTQLAVQIQERAEEKNEPSGYQIIDRTVDLTTTYTYNPTEEEILRTEPNGGQCITYRDALGRTIADTDVARPVRREDGSLATLIPLTTYARNIHGTALETRVHAEGLTQADPQTLPTLPDDPNDRVTQLAVDGLNRVVARIIDPNEADRKNSLNLRTQTRYNTKHQPAATIDAAGFISRTFYDAENRPCIQVDAQGGVITTDYDAFGQPVCLTQYGHPLDPDSLNDNTPIETVRAQIAQLPQDDISATYTLYDPSGLARVSINPVGSVTEQRYDLTGFGRQTIAYVTQTQGVLTDLPAAMTWMQTHAQPLLDATTDTLRDSAGMACFIIDPENYITQQNFNTHNQITDRAQYAHPCTNAARESLRNAPLSEVPSYLSPDPQQDITYQTTYNGHLKIEFEVFGEGNVTRTGYDGVENLIATLLYAEPLGARAARPHFVSTSSVHEEKASDMEWAFLALEEKTDPLEQQLRQHPRSPSDRLETHAYTLAKQKTQTTDPTRYSDDFQQDLFGNLTLKIDRAGQPWHYTVDRANRLIQTQAPPSISTEVTQNAVGALEIVSEQMVSAVSIRVLDPRGLPILCIEGAGLPEERRMEVDYHPVTHAITETRILGVSVDNPDALADFLNRPETRLPITTKKSYNVKLLLVAEENSDGGKTQHQHDLAGQITLSIDPRGAAVAYVRDAQGQVTEEHRYATLLPEGSTTPTPGPDDRTLTRTHDRRGQVIQETNGSVFYAVALTKQMGVLQTGLAASHTYFKHRFDGLRVRRSQERFNEAGVLEQAHTLEWFDRNGESVARILPAGATTTTTRNAFGEEISKMEYATAITAPPPITQAFDPSLLPDVSEDRKYLSEYDLLGRLTQEQRPKTILGATQAGLETGLWQRTYQYATPTATQEQPSAVCNEKSQSQYFYYNARQQRMAVRGITFTAPTLFGSGKTTPLTYEKRNVFGELVGTLRFEKGMDSATDPNQYPQPLQPGEGDPLSLTLLDARGKPIVQQDPEGNTTAITYNPPGKPARSFYWLTNPVLQLNEKGESVVVNVRNLDERQLLYDMNQNTLSSNLLRDHQIGVVENDCLRTTYNAFNEPAYEGSPSQPQAIYWRYDPLGRLWSTNADGIAKLYAYNLNSKTGQETARFCSATQPLAEKAYSDLPALMALSYLDLEIEAFVRNAAHSPVQQFLPPYDKGVDKPDTVPISVVIQQILWPNTPEMACHGPAKKHDDDMHVLQPSDLDSKDVPAPATKLIWVLPQARNVSGLRFKLAPLSNPAHTIPLPVESNTDTCSVDVSHLPIDQYTYLLEGLAPKPPYTSTPPADQAAADDPVSYQTEGRLQFITAVAENSTQVVPKVIGTQVLLYGNSADVARIRLITLTGELVLEKVVTADPITRLPSVELGKALSGDYTIAPLSSTGELLPQTLPFRLHTATLSAAPLSREINCTTTLRFFDTYGELIWTVPDDLQDNQIRITVYYKTPDQEETQEETFVLDRTTYSYYGDKIDANGETLPCNIQFSQPVDTVLALTFALSIPYQINEKEEKKEDEWALLRRQEFPINPPAHPSLQAPPTPKTKPGSMTLTLLDEKADVAAHGSANSSPTSFNHLKASDASEGSDWEMPEPEAASALATDYEMASNTGTIQTTNFLTRDMLYVTPLSGYQDDQLPTLSILNTSLDRSADWEALSAFSATGIGLVLDITSYPIGIYPYQILPGNAGDPPVLDNYATFQITRGGTIYPSDDQKSFHAARWALRSRAPIFSASAAFCEQLTEQKTVHRTATAAFLMHPDQAPAGMPSAASREEVTPLSHTPFSAAESAAMAALTGNLGTAEEKDEKDPDLVRPSQFLEYDVFQNNTAQTDPLGNRTQKQYGGFNQLICLTQPLITTVDEHGVVHPNTEPKTFFTTNFLGTQVSEIDPNGHTKRTTLDQNNQEVETILGDGTINRISRYNALSRTVAYCDANQKLYTQTYDRRGLLSSTHTPLGRVQRYQHNELGYRSADINPMDTAQRYAHDVRCNISHQIDPLNHQTTRITDRNGQPLFEQQLDGGVSHWERNYFGRVEKHTAMGGEASTYIYDLKGQPTQSNTTEPGGPDRWINTWVKVREYIRMSFQSYILGTHYLTTRVSLYGQTNLFTWQPGGRLIQQNNSAKKQVMQFGHDITGRRVSARTTTDDGRLMQATRTIIDPLGRDSWSFDSFATITKAYDPAGNTRHVGQTVYLDSSTNRTETIDAWYLHDAADRVVIDNGVLSQSTIVITPKQGRVLTYRNSLRASEADTQYVQQLGYDDDGRFVTSTSANISSRRQYRADNNVTRYDETTPGHTKAETPTLNINGWLQSTTQWSDANVATSLFYNYSPTGLCGYQHTTYSGVGNVMDDIYNTYRAYNDATLLRRVVGTRYDDYGQSTNIMEKAYDSLGAPNYVSGANEEAGKMFFESSAEGRILTAWQTVHITPLLSQVQEVESGFTRYFYDVNNTAVLGSYTGRYTVEGLPWSSGSNGMHWTLTDGIAQDVYAVVQNMFGFGNFIRYTVNYHASTTDPLKIQDPLQMVSSSYPPRTAERCVVGPSDTFESLATQHYGDPGYATLIAEANGYVVDSPISAGQVLTMPQLIASRINANTISPYEAFVNALMDQFSLKLFTPQPPPPPPPKKDHGFFHTLIHAIENVVAVVVGVILAVPTGGASLTLTGAIIAATIAMATDAALQAANIMVRLDNKFSMQEMLQVGLSAALGGYFKAELLSKSLMVELQTASKMAILQQGVELATGLRKSIDFKSIILSVVEQTAHFKIQVTLPAMNQVASQLTQTIANDVVDATLTTAVTGRLDVESFLASSIGSAVGNALGTQMAAQLKKLTTNTALDARTATTQQKQEQTSRTSSKKPAYANAGGDDDYEDGPDNSAPKTTSRTQTNKQQTVQADALRGNTPKTGKYKMEIELKDGSKYASTFDTPGRSDSSSGSAFMDYVDAFNDTSGRLVNTVVHPVDTVSAALAEMKHDAAIAMNPNASAWDIAKGNALLTLDIAEGLAMASGAGALAGAAVREVAAVGGGIARGSARFMRNVGFFGRAGSDAVNHINGLRLQQQLAQEELSSLFKSPSELTQAAIDNSRQIPLIKFKNTQLKEILEKRGNLADWGKYETTPAHTDHGLARMHFYRNAITNEIYYGHDFKAVFDHQGKWNIPPARNFSLKPGY
jgi:YD repeat-containing protein